MHFHFSDFMDVHEHLITFAAIMIIIIAGILITIYLLDQLTGGYLIRNLVCGMLYVISFGGLTTTLTRGCVAIPA